ncbi:jacalin-like lectin [Thalassomonas actiniarum]|uniref:Jacalin-type lectin domain-containing protein n=1 Tax=Thalassomonas actiniarum TaxID=485447 RepID=A0AAE9YWI3_9GAMM|nr:jacalin-like lectin [Thalassomonas actiniarum]WDE02163.1 hypothetical protein SG35_030880 [Thalassomonas actiniarum]
MNTSLVKALSVLAPVVASTLISSQAVAETWGERALLIQNMLDKDVPLAQSTWVGTHNSFANADDDDYLDVNQGDSVKNQLRAGVREIVFDVHYAADVVGDLLNVNKAVRVCHNGGSFGGCTDGITGNRKFKNALDDIAEWLNEGNRDQVVLLKLELQDSARRNINKVEDKIDNHIADYLYKPENRSYHGDLDNSTGCTELATAQISKKGVLNAGKNVIAFVTESCQSDNGFNDMVFYGGDAAEDVNSVDKLTAWSADDKLNKMSRVKDAVTKSQILSTKDYAKMVPGNVEQWLDAGLNIFELYGFNAAGSEWRVDDENGVKDYPVNQENMVWSWSANQPDDYNGEDCAMVRSDGKFNDAPCSNSYQYACYSDSTGWSLSSGNGSWQDGFTVCEDASAAFKAPVNKVQLNALNAVLGGSPAWINYSDQAMEGEWVANFASLSEAQSRFYRTGSVVGGTGGSSFDDIEQLALDQYRDKRRITKIQMSAGNRVDKVGLIYSDGQSVSHGGNGFDRELNLGPGEYIYKARACVDSKNGSDRIFYLYFETNTGKTLSGGSEQGGCTTTTAYGGYEIFAMKGRSGNELDAVGFYSRQFN